MQSSDQSGEKRFATLDDLVNERSKTMSLDAYPEDLNVMRKENEPAKETAAAEEKEKKYVAMYEYIAAHDDEVTFLEGDIISEVTSAGDDGWMVGRVERTGQYGMLPPSYVEKIFRNDGSFKDEQHNNDKQDNEKGGRRFETLDDFVNDELKTISLDTYPEDLHVMQKENERGKETAAANGKEQKYLAMYDYNAAGDDEVSFFEGDIISEATWIDEGWMEGRVERTGQYGLLPSQYVEEIFRKDGSFKDEQQNNDKQDDEKAPLEILARGPLALQVYQKALLEGKTRVKRMPMMLIGQSQSGKTSLKRSLKGERFDPDEKSTTGIEMDPSYCKVSTEVWKVGEKPEDTCTDPVPISYEQSTAEFILRNLKEEGKQPKSSDSMNVNTPELDRKEHYSDLPDASRSWDHAISHDRVVAVQEVPDDIAAVVEKLLQNDNGEKDEEEICSILWDFAGQSVYYVTHPLFLTTKALYFLVYNLSWAPNGTANPQMKPGLYKNIVDVFCDRSNIDYLDIWLSSVSSLVSQEQETVFSEILPEKLPPVFLVCTHADKPFTNKCPDEIAREIYGSLKAKAHGKHLVDVFVVDNTKSGSGQECPEVIRLRKEVLRVAKQLPQMEEVFPIKWLKYEKALQSMVNNGFKYISIDYARKIANNECGISSNEQFQALLNFLHDQRILIHFDDTPELNRMVILDLQWLVDIFKNVIATTPSEKKGRKFEELWLKLETTGILEEELLQHVWGPLFDNRETCDSLIAIMAKFCLLCPWSSSAEGKSPNEYLVPSMLMFPPKEDVTKLIASAGIPSLFVRFKSGQVPLGLFPRLVLMVFQWCTKQWLCQSQPQLHHNFARFFTHPAESCSIILLCHSSSIEVVVHKQDCTVEPSTTAPLEIKSPSEVRYDSFQFSVARTVCRQLGLILECMRKEFPWLKNMAYEMSVCCLVCCKQGSVNHCRSHKVRGCKQEECLHFWSESQLRECQEPIICTKSAVAEDYRVPVKIFGHWFKFVDEQRAIDGRDGRGLPCEEGDSEQALALPSGVLEALQLQTCDANGVVARLLESLSLEPAALKQPDPETKRQIRCLCMKAKTANRLDVVRKLREIAPAGTSGPLLPEALDVHNIPVSRRRELTINLCGRDDWKLFAERIGLSPAEILYLDKRVLNPCDAALAHSRNQGYIASVGDLYDALVDCELPVMADLL
ncbi:uncharacterized protein LOC144660431 isoform X1 [Oculina patagonica]